MNFIIPALQSADTFPQAVACAPRRCGGGKVSAGGASFRFRGEGLPSVLGGSVRALGWLYFAVQLALMGRYLHLETTSRGCLAFSYMRGIYGRYIVPTTVFSEI